MLSSKPVIEVQVVSELSVTSMVMGKSIVGCHRTAMWGLVVGMNHTSTVMLEVVCRYVELKN